MLNNRSGLLFLALALSLSWPVTAQMVHRGVFFTDITSQLPPEVLSQGRVVKASSNGQEIILLAQVGDIAAFYRQAAGGRLVSLIADNDPRIKGKFIYRPLSSRPDLISSTTYEHSLYGLGFNAFKDGSPRQSSAYYIKRGDATPEPIAVAGETITASNQFETAFPITINYAGVPSVSVNGKRRFLFLYAFQQPNNRQRSGIYAAEDGKYKQLLRSDYPTPFTISDDFGIREDKKGQLWFVEIQYNSATQSSDWYLSVFDPATGEKINVYKTGNPILGERSDYISYIRDNVSQELYATTGFYDPGQQKGRIRVVSLNLSSFPGEIFRPLFNVLSQFQDGTSIYASDLVGISNNAAVVRFWKDYQGNEIVAGLWNGENVFVLLNEDDRLPDGKQIGKLSYKIGPRTHYPGTFAGCEGTIFTFNPDGTVQYWLKFFTPCIQQAPASVKSGEEVVLKGQNLSVTASLVDVVATDDLGKETVITPTRISPTEVAFLAPSVTEAKVFKVKVRQYQSGGQAISNNVRIQVNPLPGPLPEILGVANGASFDLNQPLAPGTIFSLFGKNLGTAESAGALPLPRKLGGAKVTICGADAPLFASTGPMTRLEGGQLWQINGVVPSIASLPSCEVVVSVDQKSPTATLTARAQVKISFKSEETLALFSFTGFHPNGTQTQEPIITNQQGQLIAPPGVSIPGADPAMFTQARACEVITLWATGGGRTIPSVADGEPASGGTSLARMEMSPVVQIYGLDAEILFAGLAPGFAGLYQINVRVPCEATPGEQWLWFGRLPNTGKVYKISIQ